MGFERLAFGAGFVAGFLAGSRAGRQSYDMVVKYAQQAWQSEHAQKATATARARAMDFSKSAAQQAPKAAGSVARKAKEQAGRVNPPKRWRRDGDTTPAGPRVSPRVSVNGDGRSTTTP